MKTNLTTLGLYLLFVCHQVHAEQSSTWKPEDPYYTFLGGWTVPNLNHITSGRTQYRLIYLMQAHREAKELLRESDLEEKHRNQIYRMADDLDEVLLTCYADTISCFRSERENETLLLMIIYHYRTYVNSANEGWDEVIKVLEDIDVEVTQRAHQLSRAASPAPKSEAILSGKE